MTQSKGNRAFGYIRVSDRDQVHSLEAQESGIRKWCERNGYGSVKMFAEEGRSAHVDEIKKRPVFRPMLDAVGRHETDIVVVHTLDRWSRNLGLTLQTFQELSHNRLPFASVSEYIDWSTPEERVSKSPAPIRSKGLQ